MLPLVILIAISALLGIGMLWIFGRTSNQQAIKKVKARLQAHLYEMRLFTDEPALIWKAQVGLLAANAKYIGLMLVPALVASVPTILLLEQMECYYGRSPIPVGREAIVTAHLKEGAPSKAPSEGSVPDLQAPAGIAVETPAVWIPETREVSWRVRALQPANGELELMFPTGAVAKNIRAGSGPQYVSDRRVASLWDLIWHPGETPISNGPVDWIEISYPSASVHALGMDLHWLIWLLGVSMLSALVFKRRFRVSF